MLQKFNTSIGQTLCLCLLVLPLGLFTYSAWAITECEEPTASAQMGPPIAVVKIEFEKEVALWMRKNRANILTLHNLAGYYLLRRKSHLGIYAPHDEYEASQIEAHNGEVLVDLQAGRLTRGVTSYVRTAARVAIAEFAAIVKKAESAGYQVGTGGVDFDEYHHIQRIISSGERYLN